jgi:hypothetical protein
MLVVIDDFHTIGSDERGSTQGFQLSRKQADFLFLTRKSGSLSGNTYHEGKNLGTNPKVFLLLAGKIKLSYRKVGSEQVFENIISKPSVIRIMPLVTHKVEVLEDAAIIECNSITDIQSDRIKELV